MFGNRSIRQSRAPGNAHDYPFSRASRNNKLFRFLYLPELALADNTYRAQQQNQPLDQQGGNSSQPVQEQTGEHKPQGTGHHQQSHRAQKRVALQPGQPFVHLG